jgi:hypothetical protein
MTSSPRPRRGRAFARRLQGVAVKENLDVVLNAHTDVVRIDRLTLR